MASDLNTALASARRLYHHALNGGTITMDDVARLVEAMERARAAEARVAELERSETRLIDERDAAEDALGKAYSAATGLVPEWSNNFGAGDAVEAVGDRVAELEAALREIVAQDWVENCLDPQWAARIARRALGEESTPPPAGEEPR